MATAIRKIIEIPQPTKVESGFRLTLSGDEAATLARVCEMIGGDPKSSPRSFMNAIYAALLDAGVRPSKAVFVSDRCSAGLYFRDDIAPTPAVTSPAAKEAAAKYRGRRAAQSAAVLGETPKDDGWTPWTPPRRPNAINS